MRGDANTGWSLSEHIARKQGKAPITVGEAVDRAILKFGEAGTCPECGAPGTVELTNSVSRTTWVICNRCARTWSHRETRADGDPT